jgi:hypothetical protein
MWIIPKNGNFLLIFSVNGDGSFRPEAAIS